MCLIIKKPAGRSICADFLKNAWERNFHGWGGFFVQDGEVVWERGLDFDDLLAYNSRLPAKVEACIHLRKATYGEVNHEMAHPYMVRPGLMLMHNGSIPQLAPQNPAFSDTSELARLLGDLLKDLSDEQTAAMVRSPAFARLTAPLIDGSMVVLMDQGGVVRLGREWHTVKSCEWTGAMTGIQVSNSHTWGEKARELARQAQRRGTWQGLLQGLQERLAPAYRVIGRAPSSR